MLASPRRGIVGGACALTGYGNKASCTPHPSAYGCHLLPLEKAHQAQAEFSTYFGILPFNKRLPNARMCHFEKNAAYCQPSPAGNRPICGANSVGVAETGVEGGTRSVTDEELLKRIAKINSIRAMLMPYGFSATRSLFFGHPKVE